MINPLSVASDGYLSRTTKKALIIAVSGYLAFSDGPTPPPVILGRDADGRSMEEKRVAEIRQRVQADDAEILAIINAFIQCQR
jgi:hypothetical protein